MPLDFPNSPTVGQKFTDATAGDTWLWDGTKWEANSTASAYTGPPGPTGPQGPQGVAGPTGATGPAGNAAIAAGSGISITGTSPQTISTAVPYLPLAGGVATGQISAPGFAATGTGAQIYWADRANTSIGWLWYATGGTARLYNGADRLQIDASGNLTATGNVYGNLFYATGFAIAGTQMYVYNADGTNLNIRVGPATGAVSFFSFYADGHISVPGAVNAGGIITTTEVDTSGWGVRYNGLTGGNHAIGFGWTGSQLQAFIDGGGAVLTLATTGNLGAYLPLSGGTLSNGLHFGSALAPGGATDTSRHITLYDTGYGFSITSGALNVVAGGAAVATFTSNAISVGGQLTAANLYLTSNFIYFAGYTSNGPSISGDATNIVMAMGPNNGGLYIQNNAKTVNVHTFTIDGNAGHNGVLTTGSGVTAQGGSFLKKGGGMCYRMSPNADNTGIGSMWYTDTSNMYLLLTANNDAWGGFNSLRPFYVNLGNGVVTIGHGLTVQNNGISINPSSTNSTFIAYNGSSYVQMYNDSNGHIECNTALWINYATGQATNIWGSSCTVNGTLGVNGTSNLAAVNCSSVTIPNATWYLGKDTAGGANGLIAMWSDNNVYVCDVGHYLNLRGLTVSIQSTNQIGCNNGVVTSGSNGGFAFNDRGGAAPTQWMFYAASGYASLWNNRDGNRYVWSATAYASWNDNDKQCGVGGQAWNNVISYTFQQQSDRRYKADIEDLPPCADLLQRLTPKRYRIINGPEEQRDQTHWGFVAQDVGRVMREAGHDFAGYVSHPTGDAIVYNELVAVLWKSCQELATRLAEVEARL